MKQLILSLKSKISSPSLLIFRSYDPLYLFDFKAPFNHATLLHSAKSPLAHHNFSSLSFQLSQRNESTHLASALMVCSKTKKPVFGIQIHAQTIKFGFSKDTFFPNYLLTLYYKFGALSSALKLFDEMPVRNLVSWTSIISGCIQNEEPRVGLELFLEMQCSGFSPNEFAFGSVLKACASMKAIELGSSLHCAALKIGLEENEFVGSSLVGMYAKCGDIELAECAFESMNNCDIACWNALIGGYAFNSCSNKLMKVLCCMHRYGLIADEVTFVNALKGCSFSDGLKFGQKIHGLVVSYGLELCSSVMNSLVNMYFKAGRKDYGLMAFSRMQHRDVVSWNTVLSGFVECGNVGEAVHLVTKMFLSGLRPSQVTFSILFRLCGDEGNLFLGLQFYCLIYHLGFHDNTVVKNSVINMFFRCTVTEGAYSIFEYLPSRDISTWNEMIMGYSLNGCYTEALNFFCDLHQLGIEPNEISYSSVLAACCRKEHQDIGKQVHASLFKSGFGSNHIICCSLMTAYARFSTVDDSFNIFNAIYFLDVASWGAIISALLLHGCNYEALAQLNSLREAGEKPDEFVLGSVLNACANLSDWNHTKIIHVHVIVTGFERQLCVASALVDAYAKCGDIGSSKMIFQQLSKEGDAVFYNTMITAYAQHGLFLEAINVFERMKEANIQPNHATFVSAISACSHLGLVDQGHKFFSSITLEYGLIPSAENFSCLVDLLARNGFLEESKQIIENMPYEPWPAIWRSFLSGCRIYGHRKFGVWAAKNLLKSMPDNDAAYVLLSTIYAESGSWEDAAMVRRCMVERGVCKEPGISWINI